MQITELSKEVFRLKEALNALPESRGPPQPPPDTAALQARIRALEEKLAVGTGGLVAITWWILGFHKSPVPCSNPLAVLQDTEMQHSKVVTLYRSHLLYAVQVRWGHGCGGTGDTGMGYRGTSQRRVDACGLVGGSKGLDPGTAKPGVIGPCTQTP